MNEKIKSYLNRVADSKMRPNSFLFYGSGEAGKLEMAFYFIQKISGKSGDAEFLRRMKGGVHPDIIIVEPETVEDKNGKIREKDISIEQVREAQSRLKYFPFELEHKFCLIKKSEKMNSEAGNAMLKILEEPTEKTFFILLANDPESVLPTIVSRCAALRFPEENLPFLREESREQFRRIIKSELYEKLNFIEKAAKDKSELIEILNDWEALMADSLRKLAGSGDCDLKVSAKRMRKVAALAREIRDSINILQRTNASPRVVGEKLMLSLES